MNVTTLTSALLRLHVSTRTEVLCVCAMMASQEMEQYARVTANNFFFYFKLSRSDLAVKFRSYSYYHTFLYFLRTNYLSALTFICMLLMLLKQSSSTSVSGQIKVGSILSVNINAKFLETK